MKVAVVTGGSSGLGLAIIHQLTAQGFKAISWDINPPKEDVPFVRCDVTSEEAVKAALSQTQSQYGEPTILINNCGLQFLSPVDEFPLEKWNQLISILLTGTFLCSKVMIPGMKKNGWGRIINVSSIHGKVASPYKAAYVAAKHGIVGLTKVTALENATSGITCNAICPGWVLTPLVQKQLDDKAKALGISNEKATEMLLSEKEPSLQFTTPEEIGELAVFLCSPAANNVRGVAWAMDGGWTAQ